MTNKTNKKELINSLLPYMGLFLVVLVIFATNYKPGTYLLGWDSVQNELNPTLNIKRAVFSVWQEYQSFGLVSGMAHASDLVHALFIWVLSYLLPQNVIRYFYHHLMVFIASAGAYTLFCYLFGFKGKHKFLAFIGALFYILNLGAVQILALPFEPFSTFFAFLPWELWIFLKCTSGLDKSLFTRNLLLLFLINFLATPQAYLQTIFIVYILVLGSVSLVEFVKSPRLFNFKRYFLALFVIFAVNAFWILPQVYFLSSSAEIVRESKINQLATDIVLSQNLEKGTLESFVKLEGFYYDLYDANKQPLFGAWQDHFDNSLISVLPYLFFSLALLGLFRKQKYRIHFVLLLVILLVVLASYTWPFSTLNEHLIRKSPFISQIFRSPFTKFVAVHTLVFTYFLVSGFATITSLIERSKFRAVAFTVFSAVLVILIFIYSLPTFRGHYFADQMKVTIPQDYFDVMEFFKHENKNTRIALLPDYTFWGWFKYSWGYEGSGFIWHGIEQPIVSRTFDVWSLDSESYFWEIKTAIERKDSMQFKRVLEKYNIDYLLIDYNTLAITATMSGLQYDQIDELLNGSPFITKVKDTQSLKVYKVNHDYDSKDFIKISTKLPVIGPEIKVTNYDSAFFDMGEYHTSNDYPDVYYPFLDLMTQTDIVGKAWGIQETEDNFIFTADLENLDISNYELELGQLPENFVVFLGDEVMRVSPKVSANIVGKDLNVEVSKELVQDFDVLQTEVNNCSRYVDTVSFGKLFDYLEVQSKDRGVGCFGYELPLLAHWNGYVVKVETSKVRGKDLFFYIIGNIARKQSKVEANLDQPVEHFILPPGHYFDDGYIFSFQNPSYVNLETVNRLKSLEVYLIPYDYLKSIKLVKKSRLLPRDLKYLSTPITRKANYYTYIVENPGVPYTNITLYQAYDDGWTAYRVENSSFLNTYMPFVFGKKIDKHFMVNNWANGWVLDESSSSGEDVLQNVVIVFWPQILEYVGFVVLAMVFVLWKIWKFK